MKMEGAMIDPVEKIIRDSLAASPPPKLSAGFKASVMDRLDRLERKREWVRGTGVILGVYWFAVLAFSGFVLAGIEWPAWSSPALVALTPFVFLAAAVPRRFFLRVARALSLSPR